MARATPVVQANVLSYQQDGQRRTVHVGTPAWYSWLERATVFAVVTGEARFTARKERAGNQRGGWYWRAYRRTGQRLHRAYLGKSDELTLARLHTVAQMLAHPSEEAAEWPNSMAATISDSQAVQHDPLLATKLHMTHSRTLLVPRSRLITQLEQSVERLLTVVIAPAGFGKTTLLSQWIADSDTPATWLSLEPADNEPVRFLTYLIAAIQRLNPQAGIAALSLLRAPQPVPPESILAVLINDLTASMSGPCILVLDDYHAITTERIHRAMRFLIEHLPPQLHVVLATRADPPLPLARLRASGQLVELRGADLRFTADEAATFLTSVMGLPLSAADIAALADTTEGWIAGLQLAALSMRGQDDLSGFITALTGNSRYILEYLTEEVLSRQSDDVQLFLLHTSVLDRLCGPLCDALTGKSDGQAMLERLEAANLFLISLDQERRWYRYHHLFADVLRNRLRQMQPDRIPVLHRLAARWCEENGLSFGAIHHALAGQDFEWAARLIEQRADTMLWKRGEVLTLQGWLESLPDATLRASPRLCLSYAWLLLWSGQVDAVEPLLRAAVTHMRGREETPLSLHSESWETVGQEDEARAALVGEIATIQSELARIQGNLPMAIARARKALAILPDTPRRVEMRGISLGILAGAYHTSGDVVAASEVYAEAGSSMQSSGQIVPALIAFGYLILLQTKLGRLHQAADTYRRTLRLAVEQRAQALPPLGVAAISMGGVLREWNDLDVAERHVREGIAHCQQWAGLADVTLDGYLSLARICQARGDGEAALDAISKAEQIAEQYHLQRLVMRVTAARTAIWIAQGNFSAAAAWAASRQRELPLDGEIVRERQDEYVIVARLLMAQGKPVEAARLLGRLLQLAEAAGATGQVIGLLALQAICWQEQAQTAQAMIVLTRALALGEPEGYVRTFVDERAPMARLLRQADAREVAPNYVGKLLAAFGQLGSSLAPVAQALHDPLSARELEILRLVASGLSTNEIATTLVITDGTVRNHLKHLYFKLGAHSRVQAVERARALHLL
ncbi:MAG TPA: LuxR C-terminal-related transcriptional regulator [Ktedonobacterales bacterium]|nr:LuxR C-terminal-related transcriptional regulator [Ktedonobacterales bacterium]